MNWEQQLFELFDDLEGQAEGMYAAERSAELADRSRAAYAEVLLASRLMAAVGSDLTVQVDGVGPVHGRLARAGSGWLLLDAGDQEWIVRTEAVVSVQGAPTRAVPEVAWSPLARLALTSALRRLGEAADPCLVHLLDGRRLEGVVRRVGADFAELEIGQAAEIVLVAFTGIAAVQSRR